MALFRHVRTEFWKDPRVLEEMTPEDKLFFLYLLTNPNTTQTGIYRIAKKQIAFEMGYSVECVATLIDRFENYYKIIKYNSQTREIAIKNWGKYNLNKGGKPIMDCIKKELEDVKDKGLISFVANNISKQDIKKEFDKVVNVTYDDSYDNNLTIRGQKEKEKEKEEEKEKQKLINHILDNKFKMEYENRSEEFIKRISRFKILYGQNVGLINGIVAQWLIELCESIDYELFERAIEIATDKGRCNKGYINGILKQWDDNNIKSIDDLRAYEVGLKNRGDKKYKCESSKSKYARVLEEEDENLYRKATEEELQAVRKDFELFKK